MTDAVIRHTKIDSHEIHEADIAAILQDAYEAADLESRPGYPTTENMSPTQYDTSDWPRAIKETILDLAADCWEPALYGNGSYWKPHWSEAAASIFDDHPELVMAFTHPPEAVAAAHRMLTNPNDTRFQNYSVLLCRHQEEWITHSKKIDIVRAEQPDTPDYQLQYTYALAPYLSGAISPDFVQQITSTDALKDFLAVIMDTVNGRYVYNIWEADEDVQTIAEHCSTDEHPVRSAHLPALPDRLAEAALQLVAKCLDGDLNVEPDFFPHAFSHVGHDVARMILIGLPEPQSGTCTTGPQCGCQPYPPLSNTDDEPDRQAREAKAIVALAFRNGPIEDVHAGQSCPSCAGEPQYSHITQAKMKDIMKTAVDRVYTIMRMREEVPDQFDRLIGFGSLYTRDWDDPNYDPTNF